MDSRDYQKIRQLFDDYLQMYSSRDDRLTTHFSEDFSGFTGGGDFLVKNREEWVAITRQDFAQIKDPVRIELKDLAIQSLADTIAVATGFFTIHLPIEDHILSQETARLVLIFRLEGADWKISHSSISIPYHLVREGEIYPMQELTERNQFLENLITERTTQLSEANDILQQTNKTLAREIEKHKQTEEALRREQLFSKSVIKSLPGVFYLYSYPELRLIAWNKEHESLLGYTSDEMEGRHVTDWHLPEAKEAVLNVIEVGMTKGSASIEASLLTKDGQSVPFILTGIKFEAHGRLYLMGIGIDIRERKHAEAQAEKLQAQLIQVQKMESVGRLAGGVAHDFNNMLGVILGHAEMAMTQLDPNQSVFADLEEIRKAASRSADLTRQLLAFARKQTITPKELDLNETIEGMLKMLRRLIGEDIDLVWMPGSGLWPVKLDPSQMDQILVNLCINARDAIAGVGKITVETDNSTLDDEFCATHTGCVAGEYVKISVSDSGCGMDKFMLSHIFEPFFTTKEVGAGTGLGLATVYGAIKQNNGYVDVYSEPKKGAVFTIYLPRFTDMGKFGSKERSAEPDVGGHQTILLVEDEPTILKMTTTMLQLLGYTVMAANNPGKAISLVENFAHEIHLLMTDVIMPEMNGRELAERLMTDRKGMKCLFMSGYTSDIIANKGVLVEGTHFIQKPFSKTELAIKIREVLNTAKGVVF